jgi:TIR domain-containing protein
MRPIYRICVFGDTTRFDAAIKSSLESQLGEFDLKIGQEIELQIESSQALTADNLATVGVFFGSNPVPQYVKPPALQSHHPIIPVVTNLTLCSQELPKNISEYNAMESNGSGKKTAIASSILECLGLMSSRRRVFLSYRRIETREVALQLFDELSSRQFDVFLDTHEIRPGAIFQDTLWHQLCDADVMLMLDTKTYFKSRWTAEEFGKANLKKAAILRLGFPDVVRDKNLSVTETLNLSKRNFQANGLIDAMTLDKIADSVERLRSKSVAVRQANLIGSLRAAVSQLKGTVQKPGPLRRLLTTFPNGKSITIYPTVGVPTSELVNKIANDAGADEFAILYDNAGVLVSWQNHLEWLGYRVDQFRWIKAEASGRELMDFAK